ncbi:hypothetical protein LXL04_005060 [Taraxacum kok-saghyz]
MPEPHNPNTNIITDDDILLCNILPRLPAKSVGRFMCVSRQWHSFLTTPLFKKLQLHRIINADHHIPHKLLLLYSKTPCMFRTVDSETPQYSLTPWRRLPFEVGYSTWISIVASLHGLVCVQRGRSNEARYYDLILWNPLTSDYKKLSKPSSDQQSYNYIKEGRFGLYYSTFEDDYKLICVTLHPNVYIYSLKTDSWRKVELESTTAMAVHYDQKFVKPSVLVDEKLYLLKEKRVNYREDPLYSITMFDIKTKKLREIATPTFVKQVERKEFMGLIVLRGCVHLCVAFTGHDESYTIELWRMDEDGDGDWMKMVTYFGDENEKLLHVMRNGDLLICCGGYFYQKDMKNKKHEYGIMYRFEGMDINQGWKYMETLVSPNQYMKRLPPAVQELNSGTTACGTRAYG